MSNTWEDYMFSGRNAPLTAMQTRQRSDAAAMQNPGQPQAQQGQFALPQQQQVPLGLGGQFL